MSKLFSFFEACEGGMDITEVHNAQELSFLRGWMYPQNRQDDVELVAWMATAQVGEMYTHRLCALVRLKDE